MGEGNGYFQEPHNSLHYSVDQFKEISFSKNIVEQKFSNLFSNSFDTGSMNFNKDSFDKREKKIQTFKFAKL